MTFYWKFFDTLVYNVATICAFIVAVSQFLIRSFNENDGSNKVRKFINQTLLFVNRSTSTVYNFVNEDTLPEVKKPKRRAA
jgi:hypothetical protein